MDFKLSPAAELDVEEITDYYASVRADLADSFVSELESALQDLCDEPNIGSRQYAHFLPDRSLRSWHLDRFPFILFYRIDASELDLLRVLHERRDLSPALIAV
ncbi:type II toxin-antitoxin system RelE/ParE family toxin [Duganella sp. PWIR1]